MDDHTAMENYNRSTVAPFVCCVHVRAGSTVYSVLCSLLATLLVLKQLSNQLPSTFSAIQFYPKLKIVGHIASHYHSAVQRAVDYATKLDSQYPSLYSRLDLGTNWDSALNDIVSKR